MAILQNRRTVFSLSNSEVMSNSAPSTEAGITKSEGHDGFFIYSDKAFTLWFKNQAGNWSSYNTYNLVDLDNGVAFSWGTNTAAFVQTDEASHSIAVFVIETKEVGQYKNIENRTISEAGLNRLDIHSNYKRVRMQNSGHTGEAYAIAIFDENGEAAYVSAPPSGQREGKVLGWDENGNLGWTTLAAAVVPFTSYGDTTETDGIYCLDGNGDYLTYDGEFRYTDQFSISVWFKSNGNMANIDAIFSNHDGGGDPNGNAVILNPDGTLHVKTLDSGRGTNGDALNIGSNLADGKWHHLVLTWQASTTNGRKVYVDGQLIHQNNSGAPNAWRTDSGSKTYIGALWLYTTGQFSSDYWFDGCIKDFSIVNSITTAQEVSDDFAAQDPILNPIVTTLTAYGDTTETDGVYTLDGNGDYLTYDGEYKFTDEITVTAWFKTTATGDRRIYSSHVRNAGTNGFFARLQDGTLKVRHPDGGHGELSLTSGLNDGAWHQLVVTYQANTTAGKKVYVDGVQVYSNNSGTANGYNNSYDLLIGANPWSGNNPYGFFDGEITNFSVSNSVSTAQEVSDDYIANHPTVEVATPNVYFDGSSTDAQIGNNSVSLVGGASLSTTNGKYDTAAFNFGTSGNKSMLLSSGIALNGTYTFSTWFYNKRAANHGALIKKNATGLAGAHYPLLSHLVDGDELGMYNGAFRGSGYSMSSLEGLQEWTHIAVVANGSNSTFYINGQQVGNVVPHVVIETVQRIGGYGDADQTFAEFLDEFAYWDSALTPGQIVTIYNSSVKLNVLAPVQAPTPQHLEESPSATLVADAVITNGILDLDGTGDYLSIPHDVAYDRESGDMSVMLWFKPRAIGYLSALISKGTGNPSWDGWIVAVTEDGLSATDLNGNSMANGGFRFFNSAGSTNDIKYLAPTGGISLNQWHHMTLVMKAAGAYEFYYDGNLLGTFTPSSKSTTTNTELLMGANKDGGSQPAYNRMFNGQIDGVTIIKEALTSDQIAAAYNAGAPE